MVFDKKYILHQKYIWKFTQQNVFYMDDIQTDFVQKQKELSHTLITSSSANDSHFFTSQKIMGLKPSKSKQAKNMEVKSSPELDRPSQTNYQQYGYSPYMSTGMNPVNPAVQPSFCPQHVNHMAMAQHATPIPLMRCVPINTHRPLMNNQLQPRSFNSQYRWGY
ncbi:hypothetical protein GJ496_003029 [Pomphorhynchus laevis]|nr:hypothetical protein GJ496_003029 [Pomphorhynchus laevis]